MVAHNFNLSTQEVEASKAHPQLHSESEVSTGYRRPCVKTRNRLSGHSAIKLLKLRQEDPEFEINLGYCSKTINRKKERGREGGGGRWEEGREGGEERV